MTSNSTTTYNYIGTSTLIDYTTTETTNSFQLLGIYTIYIGLFILSAYIIIKWLKK